MFSINIYWLFLNLKMIIFVFLCNTGYSKPNGTGVQVSRCLWILVTNHKIILSSRLFIPKMEFNFFLIHIHASDFYGTHQLHESLLAQNGGILGGQPYRFHISFQKIYNYK